MNLPVPPQPPVEAVVVPAPGATPVLDAAALARLAELDPTGKNKLLERILQAFRNSVDRLRPTLAAARQSGDRPGIRLVAHTFKSSSASIGALRLSKLCAEVETMIRLDPDADLASRLDELDGALDEALVAIENALEERT